MAREAENESGSGPIAWASAALNLGTIFLRAAQTAGRKLAPAFQQAGSHLGNAATVGAVAYEVYHEEGLTHKGERAAAGLATAGMNLGLAGAAATTGEAAALSGVAGATGATVMAAAAPVALSVVAAGATAKVADMAIENRRGYAALDRDTALDAAAQKIRNRIDTEKPSILDYKHMGAMREVTVHMRDSALHASAPIERFGGSGRIRNLNAVDMTEPENLAEFERALNTEIERQKGIMTAHDSYLPRWMRHGDSVNRYNFADGELQNLLGAKEELAMFRQDVQRWNESRASGDIAKAAGHETTGSRRQPEIATGFHSAVAGTAGAQPEVHPENASGVANTDRPSRPVRPG